MYMSGNKKSAVKVRDKIVDLKETKKSVWAIDGACQVKPRY